MAQVFTKKIASKIIWTFITIFGLLGLVALFYYSGGLRPYVGRCACIPQASSKAKSFTRCRFSLLRRLGL